MTLAPTTLAALALLAASAPVKSNEPWKTTPLPAPAPKPAEEGKTQVDGATLYWASFGKGEPVILLHGGAGNSEHWSNQIAVLAERYRVIAIDSRGHGRSTRDAKPITYHRMAEDVLAVMNALELEKASLVGWSDGGVIGLDLAIHHPERVAKLVCFGSNYNQKGLRPSGGAKTFATYFEKATADYQRLSPTPKEYKAFLAAMTRVWKTEPNYSKDELARVTAPTLVLDGDHDEIIRPEHAKEMASLIPGAKLVLIAEASHFAHWQRPEAFNRALLEFLGGTAPAP